jgi:hypothetical protein
MLLQEVFHGINVTGLCCLTGNRLQKLIRCAAECGFGHYHVSVIQVACSANRLFLFPLANPKIDLRSHTLLIVTTANSADPSLHCSASSRVQGPSSMVAA